MSDTNEPVDLSDIEYPDGAGYPDGEGVVGNGPTTEAVPSGVDPTIADEPEDPDEAVSTDEETLEENDG
ncbi:hypothetical protein [Herbiconiux daphne]|uniref:Uncharacterized protein n=1 Tax=Herbiconiux daphne TaxID=2970914 RepID=A0ABT2H870_9MICO|nr:hypothetical protein [Herbiconiux daphne]MCS5736156.1 hypothetical protein [Herbiconiux daphne]